MKTINTALAAIQNDRPVTYSDRRIYQYWGERNTGFLTPSFIANPVADELLVDLTSFLIGVDSTHHELDVAVGVKLKDARIIAATYLKANPNTEIEMRLVS